MTKLTEKGSFLKAYAKTLGHISKACEAVKISRQTYYNWLEDDPDFKQAIDNIDDSFIDLAESALRANIENKVQRAIEFYLCNKKKSKYAHTFRGELSGVDGEPIKYIIEKTYEQPINEKKEGKKGEKEKSGKAET